jgi:hypothetical protein
MECHQAGHVLTQALGKPVEVLATFGKEDRRPTLPQESERVAGDQIDPRSSTASAE